MNIAEQLGRAGEESVIEEEDEKIFCAESGMHDDGRTSSQISNIPIVENLDDVPNDAILFSFNSKDIHRPTSRSLAYKSLGVSKQDNDQNQFANRNRKGSFD